ncbi:MAG: hypothetical protein DGJ47_000910 [Rickettsiaceae bacterium]
MEGDIALISEAIKSASRFLLRDYYELEQLQNSNNNTINFSNKSGQKAMQTLSEKLSKYFKKVVFDKDEVKNLDIKDKAVLVETLEGFGNFTRAIPFFAIMVTLLRKKDDRVFADKSIISFPALGEFIHVQKGQGALLERYASSMQGAMKLRTSQTKDIENAIGVFDRTCCSAMVKHIPNFRFYNSYTYSVLQFLSGKVDVLCIKNTPISVDGIRLFVEESGGRMEIKNGKIIASNISLFDKVIELID